MDPLVKAAGTALVAAIAADGWREARDGAVDLWRRASPERASAIGAELGEVRGEVLAAREAGDRESENALVGEWRRKLARLVAADPAMGAEIRRVLNQVWKPLLPEGEQARAQHISLHATASGHARVYQAGRDQHITE